jgi:hypothetical protein
MSRHLLTLMALLASATNAQDASTQKADAAAKPEKPAQSAATAADGEAQADVKTLSGISILGNQEAPKSLVIVPWKSSEIGAMPGLSRLLDDSVQPVDKEVFMRELDYYQIRSGSQ